MHRTCVALCFLCVCFCLPGRVSSQAGSHLPVSLSGVVFSEGGTRRIANASLRLSNDGQSSWLEIITGDSGEFNFQGLPAGRFLLQVRALGFEALDKSVDLSFSSEQGLSIFLKPSGAANQNSAPGSTISVHELSMPAAARELVASGKKKLYAEKNLRGALKDFQAAVAKAPQYYEAVHLVGMAYLALQDMANAEKNFRASVELSRGEFPGAEIALGSLLADRGDGLQAEPLLRHGLELSPGSWIALYQLATIELSRGHLGPARQFAQHAESLAPAQPLPHRALAIIDLQEKNYPALLDELDAFIALEPDTPAGIRAKELRAQTQKTLEATAKQPQ